MARRDLGTRVSRRAARARVPVDADLAQRLAEYVEMLSRWNARMNLTSLDDSDTSLDRLVVEPLAAARHLPARGAVIDIGSGGGSPAIPIKMARPDLALRMVEGKARKGAFLRDAVRQLALESALVEGSRYEELLARPELHEAHDVLTIRAVRLEARTLRSLQAFVAPGGALLLFRGGSAADAPKDLQPPLVWEATYPLVESLRSRLVVLRKMQLR